MQIPLAIPHLTGNASRYINECITSGWVSSVGPFVDRLEQQMTALVGASHAVATVNGTAALHMALLVAGVQRDDEVLVPALTFIAPANAVRYIGAHPVFIDCDPNYWQMDPDAVTHFLEYECHMYHGALIHRRTGRHVRTLLPVHLLGHPCDMDALCHLAARYGLTLIEDASESLGATYRGRPIGSHGHIACFSFNGNKTVTTGGGGMLVTNDAVMATRARYLTTQAKDDPVEYVHREVGYNYRLTNLQAALGCAQLEQLDDFIARKRRHAQVYCEAFADLPGIQIMTEAPWAQSTFWLYTILIDETRFGRDRHTLAQSLAMRGIQTRPLWQPLCFSPAHAGAYAHRIEHAARIQRQALSLPSSVGLTDADQQAVIAAVRNAS